MGVHKTACTIDFEFTSDQEDWRTALDDVIVDEVPLKDLTTAEQWQWFEEQAPASLDNYLTLLESRPAGE